MTNENITYFYNGNLKLGHIFKINNGKLEVTYEIRDNTCDCPASVFKNKDCKHLQLLKDNEKESKEFTIEEAKQIANELKTKIPELIPKTMIKNKSDKIIEIRCGLKIGVKASLQGKYKELKILIDTE